MNFHLDGAALSIKIGLSELGEFILEPAWGLFLQVKYFSLKVEWASARHYQLLPKIPGISLNISV